jgi:hypothetical protein
MISRRADCSAKEIHLGIDGIRGGPANLGRRPEQSVQQHVRQQRANERSSRG